MLKKLSTTELILKILAGLGGGVAGTLIMLLIFVLGSSVFKNVFSPEQAEGMTSINPLFIFAYLVMIFLGILTANILSSFLIGLNEKDKYKRINSSIYQIFIANVVLFVITAPIYIITAGVDVNAIIYITALHVILSIIGSSLILEIMADSQYSLIALYSIILAILVSAVLNLFVLKITQNPMILLFIGLPILWTATSGSLAITNLIYNVISNVYGIDFLSTKVNYGNDDRTEEEVVEEEVLKQEKEVSKEKRMETGAEFLERGEG